MGECLSIVFAACAGALLDSFVLTVWHFFSFENIELGLYQILSACLSMRHDEKKEMCV